VKPNLLILFSGGADSVSLLHIALEMKYEPYCVLIDYDQNHKIELDFARNYLAEQHIPYQTVQLYSLGLKSGLTTGEKSLYDGVNEMYVPSRNLMFVSIAASIAENKRINKIWYGANYSDRLDGFPDCTQEWVVKMNELLKINSVGVRLEAPLLGFSKETVLRNLEMIGVPMDKVFSGYLEEK